MPEQRNLANLAGAIEENIDDYALVLVSSERAASAGAIELRNGADTQRYVQAMANSMAGNANSPSFSLTVPIAGGSSLPKVSVAKAYINTPSLTQGYVFGGGSSGNTSFSYLREVRLAGVKKIGPNFCRLAVSLEQLILPNNVEEIGDSFCYGCDALTNLYVPNVPPPEDLGSLSTNSAVAPIYAVGITLTGPGATAWKEALPDSDSYPYYRKIILG